DRADHARAADAPVTAAEGRLDRSGVRPGAGSADALIARGVLRASTKWSEPGRTGQEMQDEPAVRGKGHGAVPQPLSARSAAG
ncbi:hypothetical protein, partial [Lacticaseibacillus rhamnosus]|uniref:hypothetical protein n=1 Tax=Lacticaseibacillus rhamnosus TaxID=47715 RepID=UPI003F44EF88